MYWGIKDFGSNKNGIKISNISKRIELIGTHSRFHSNKETSNFILNNGITEVIPFGSALKFCKLAEGMIDIYPRYTGSMEWDIAAGDIILEESSCNMVSLKNNQVFQYNKRNLVNDSFIASRADLLDEIKFIV